MAVDPSVKRYREQFRAEENCRKYPGWLHLAFTSAASLTVVILCLMGLEQVKPLEWVAIPLAFLYANGVEYLGHRGPMHHPVKWLGLIFFRHTKQHHRFFTDREMTFDSSNDFKAVLFPPVMMAWLPTANLTKHSMLFFSKSSFMVSFSLMSGSG